MQILRDATRLAHARIEAALPVLDPELSRGSYTRVIQAFYGFYAPLEPCLALALPAEGAALALEQRAKVPLLVTDLIALGRTPSEVDVLPQCRRLPGVASASHAIGVLYVFEGATLGGQIIRKHLRARLDIDPSSGAAFFSGYLDATRAMWMQFVDHVERSSSLVLDEAVVAAVDTFETLTSWLQSSLAQA